MHCAPIVALVIANQGAGNRVVARKELREALQGLEARVARLEKILNDRKDVNRQVLLTYFF